MLWRVQLWITASKCPIGYIASPRRSLFIVQIMRKSAEFKQLALIEHVNNVTTIWPLKVTHGDKYEHSQTAAIVNCLLTML